VISASAESGAGLRTATPGKSKRTGATFKALDSLRVTIHSIQNSDWKHIPAFLKDMPAVHAGIKRIYITVDARDDLDDTPVRSAAILFPTWCETISKKLILEHFQILLDLDEYEISSLLLGTGPLVWTLARRKLRVTKDYRPLPDIRLGQSSLMNVSFGGPQIDK
jgi:hypothetical protein